MDKKLVTGGVGRRAVMAGLAGAALFSPRRARAQGALPVVGLLYPGTRKELETRMAAFLKPLATAGFEPGKTVTIDVRTAEGHFDRLPELAAALARENARVIVAASAAAAVAAPPDVPMVFIVATDPVLLGLIPKPPRTGGNATGIYAPNANAEAKRLEMVHELLPVARTVGILVNPSETSLTRDIQQSEMLRRAASQLGVSLLFANAGSEFDLGNAFESFKAAGATAVLENIDPAFAAWRRPIAALQIARRLPVVAVHRDDAAAGAFASYSGDLDQVFGLAGSYAAQILKGAKPAELRVLETTRFALAINLKTARQLSIAVPPDLIGKADEVFR